MNRLLLRCLANLLPNLLPNLLLLRLTLGDMGEGDFWISMLCDLFCLII